MANWPDNKAPRHDVDDSTPRVVPGALLHSRHHTRDLPHRDQHATQAQEPDISAYNTGKLRAVALSLADPAAAPSYMLGMHSHLTWGYSGRRALPLRIVRRRLLCVGDGGLAGAHLGIFFWRTSWWAMSEEPERGRSRAIAAEVCAAAAYSRKPSSLMTLHAERAAGRVRIAGANHGEEQVTADADRHQQVRVAAGAGALAERGGASTGLVLHPGGQRRTPGVPAPARPHDSRLLTCRLAHVTVGSVTPMTAWSSRIDSLTLQPPSRRPSVSR